MSAPYYGAPVLLDEPVKLRCFCHLFGSRITGFMSEFSKHWCKFVKARFGNKMLPLIAAMRRAAQNISDSFFKFPPARILSISLKQPNVSDVSGVYKIVG